MEVVTSFSNPLIKRFKRLHRSKGRRESGQTILEGPRTLALAIDAGTMPRAVLCLEDDHETLKTFTDQHGLVTLVSYDVMAAAADTVRPLGPIMIIDTPNNRAIRQRNTVVLCDVQDPGNVGTVLRSAAAFGWDVCISGVTADIWSPKVLRAGAGSHFGLHLSNSDTPLDDAKAVKLEVVASVVDGGGEPTPVHTPVALLVGSEAHGLAPRYLADSNRSISLPMPGGTESLNAAVAASILMYVLG